MKTSKKKKEIDLILKSTWLAVSKMYSELAQEYNSTAVQALTLLKIDPKKGTRSTNLGPKMSIEPTSLTRIIKILEEKGYIFKEKSSKDKREVIIKLTDKGMKHRNISKDVVVGFNEMVLRKIPIEKIEMFEEVMEDILKIAKDINEKNRL